MKKNHQLGNILKKSDKKIGKILSSSVEVLCVTVKKIFFLKTKYLLTEARFKKIEKK